MRRITLAAALLCAAAAPAAAQQNVLNHAAMQRETAVWQAVKDKRPQAFAAMMAPGYHAVYAQGVVDKAQEVAQVSGADLRSFDITGLEAHQPDPRTIVVTYHVDVQGTAGQWDFSGAYWCSSVWKLTGGRWVGILHTEAKADPQQ